MAGNAGEQVSWLDLHATNRVYEALGLLPQARAGDSTVEHAERIYMEIISRLPKKEVQHETV